MSSYLDNANLRIGESNSYINIIDDMKCHKKMNEEKSQIRLKEIIDNLLLINLFVVVFFAIFFIFAVIMQINGVFIFLNSFQNLWNPIIVPLITILIVSTLVSAINSWWRRKWLSQEEDI